MRHVARGAALVLLVIGVLVASGRLRVEPVLTGSMAPHYPAGTLVAVTPVSDVHVGEVIMFSPPQPWAGHPVLHRVVSVTTDGIRTQGDANAALDPWVLDPHSPGLARLRWSSQAFGRLVAAGRQTLHGPGLLVWPGVLLLLQMRRRPRYRPRHTAQSLTTAS